MPNAESLEAKVRLLADRAEIEELIANYAITVDERDFTAWQKLFAENGGYGKEPNRIPKPLLIEAGEAFLCPYPASHHFIGHPSIQIDGDTAKARCPGMTHHIRVQQHPSQSNIVGGWMHFTFCRTPDGWRILDMVAQLDWSAGGDYVAGAAGVFDKVLGRKAS